MLKGTFTLNNGFVLPSVAIGTWPMKDEECKEAVKTAIRCGYKSIDTAYGYGNEAAVGDAIRELGAESDDIVITSKLTNTRHGYDNALRTFDESEKNLGRVDVYLIHWPGKDLYVETWKAFERIYKEKRVKAIGVSNFLPHHIDRLLDECEICPAVDQMEAHPYFMNKETVKYCMEKNIQVEAYTPVKYAMEDAVIAHIAEKYGKTVVQIILNYMVSKGYRVLPKSSTAERIISNIKIFDFELETCDIQKIESLETGERRGFHPDEWF